jgi:arylsulfatase A-like enzyme
MIRFLMTMALAAVIAAPAFAEDIAHDTEYYILEAQNGEQWAADDKSVDQKLAEFREKNGGKSPNIIYILVDDMGFGDIGIPELNAIRGYKTPNLNRFADESMRFARMYTEPSCTPTRVAFMTGRQPQRNGMADTAVDIAGFGLADKEVTIAEVLSDAGFNTIHIGKWHMGDIEEAWPNNQGFDWASFAIHQQGQLTIYNDDAADEQVSIGIGENNYDSRFTLDRTFRPDASHMVTAVEGARGEKVHEVNMEPGERWTQAKYDEMNARFQSQALEQLRELAGKDEPFFLQYWPMIPLYGPRTTIEKYTTPNGGNYVEQMKILDGWIGEILAEMDELGLVDDTIVVVMGDNGHFTKYSPQSGFTPLIYRGGKGYATEGGVRVDAFARWPGMIEDDSIVMDIVHVTDLFTSLARLGGAMDGIPTDRVIDGVDQTALMLLGETHGRRDHVMIYQVNKLAAVVKEQYKLFVPAAGDNPITAPFYDLFRDTREEYPVATEVGAWGGQEFVRIIQRHMMRKQKYPDEGPARGVPYEGISNLRPESKAAVEAYFMKQSAFSK